MRAPKNLRNLATVFESECHMGGLIGTARSMLAEVGLTLADDSDDRIMVGYDDNSVSLSMIRSFPEHDDDLYDQVTSHKESYISDTETICLSLQRQIIALPQNIQIRVALTIGIPLPEDDLKTLQMLGKVHTEVTEASLKSSVVCTI